MDIITIGTLPKGTVVTEELIVTMVNEYFEGDRG